MYLDLNKHLQSPKEDTEEEEKRKSPLRSVYASEGSGSSIIASMRRQNAALPKPQLRSNVNSVSFYQKKSNPSDQA